jgi:hypothetical protein
VVHQNWYRMNLCHMASKHRVAHYRRIGYLYIMAVKLETTCYRYMYRAHKYHMAGKHEATS